jgi:uncharacterized protein YoxC
MKFNPTILILVLAVGFLILRNAYIKTELNSSRKELKDLGTTQQDIWRKQKQALLHIQDSLETENYRMKGIVLKKQEALDSTLTIIEAQSFSLQNLKVTLNRNEQKYKSNMAVFDNLPPDAIDSIFTKLIGTK